MILAPVKRYYTDHEGKSEKTNRDFFSAAKEKKDNTGEWKLFREVATATMRY